MMTQHPNSVVNPDVVAKWAKDEPKHVQSRYETAKALLPNIERYYSSEFPRAKKAVELWELALNP